MTTGTPQSYVFRDAKGQTATLKMYRQAIDTAAHQQADAQAIASDLLLLTNSASIVSIGVYSSPAAANVYGGTGDFQNVEDKAVFVFTTAAGGIHRYAVPAPLQAVFKADLETIDNTVSPVKQFIADMLHATYGGTAPTTLNAACDRAGLVLTSYVGGIRRRAKFKRKFNIFTLDPTLGGEGE